MRLDEEIKKDIVDSLYWDNRVDAADIAVSVEDGNVVLSGSVPSYAAKTAATKDARMVTGVLSLDNQLEVAYPLESAIPSDETIRSNVIEALRRDPDLYAYKTDVRVAGGWVTLEGTVDAFWKKMQAEDIVLGIRGVLGITNKLAVVPTEEITDEALAEDIVRAIDRNSRVFVDDVDVIVRDGKVILSGTVPSWTAKSAAYNAALYTWGVTDVEDNMVVERIPQPV